ncbi:FkbM family methyltransferase [bacterium]|nr:FkbM family methyltransferase [bacterium]
MKRNPGRYKSLHTRPRENDYRKWSLRMLDGTMSDMSLKDLRAICTDYSLSPSGSKSTLAKRIEKSLMYTNNTFIKKEKNVSIKCFRFDFINEIIRLENDFYENKLLEKIKKSGNKDRVSIDVGGHVGNHTLYFSMFCNFGHSYIFEPREELIDLIVQNVKNNNLESKVTLNLDGIKAISSSPGMLKFEKRKDFNLGTGKILKSESGETPVSTIDDLFLNKDVSVGLIKIDVEGLEYDVLLGAKEVIKKFSPTIIIETNMKSDNNIDHESALSDTIRFLGEPNYKKKYQYGAIPGPFTYILTRKL